ncbi:MAG: aldo/keto reductase [Pseudomonadota bacterium]
MMTLHANGANIPALGLGTWELRGEPCAAIVEQALREGYRHIDTAIMYQNEEAVGEGIRASGVARDDIFLTTKVWPSEMTSEAFDDAVAGSLQQLGVNHVDLLLIHWPPQENDETLWANLLNNAAENGWTKHIGVSNFTTTQINAMVQASHRPLACNQVEHHPYIDQSKLRAVCAQHGIVLMAYCPIYRGEPLFSEPIIKELTQKHDRTPAQIVLRWHVQQAGCGAIPKTATPERLAENKDIFDFALAVEDMRAIKTLVGKYERLCDFEFSPEWDEA